MDWSGDQIITVSKSGKVVWFGYPIQSGVISSILSKVRIMDSIDKVRYALSRIDWAETLCSVWVLQYTRSGLFHKIPNLHLKCKVEGLINHDRVLHDRHQRTPCKFL